MKKTIEWIKEKITESFVKAGYDKKYGMVSVSNRPDLCQYQCNGAMAAAKAYKKAPIQIAQEVIAPLLEDAMFSKNRSSKSGIYQYIGKWCVSGRTGKRDGSR